MVKGLLKVKKLLINMNCSSNGEGDEPEESGVSGNMDVE